MNYRIIIIVFLFYACSSDKSSRHEIPVIENELIMNDSVISETDRLIPDTTGLEKNIIAAGLIAVSGVDATILTELKYSTTDNFMQEDVYGDFDRLYLQPDVAEKLKMAQQYLREKDSALSLLVYDGVRPRSIQQKMWDIVDMPEADKPKFVSNPKNGSLHNYGAAVDLTIAKNGVPLDMGSPYDDANEISYPSLEAKFLQEGLLSQEQIDNRKLLRTVMWKAGFFGIQTEWWHFNSCTREEAKLRYKIVE